MKVHAGSDADWEARAGASQSQRHLSSDVEKGDPSKPSRRDFAQRLAALAVSGDLPVHKRTHRDDAREKARANYAREHAGEITTVGGAAGARGSAAGSALWRQRSPPAPLPGSEVGVLLPRANLHVPPWPGGHKAAAALTFDDGTPEQIKALTKYCAQAGAHCTLFLAGTFSGSADWEKINEEAAPAAVRAALVENWSFKPEMRGLVREFLDKGNEIGSHTLHHRDLCKEPGPKWWNFTNEIDDLDEIFRDGLGVWPEELGTFAYPFGSVCDDVRAAGRNRFVAMRTTQCDAVDPGLEDWFTRVPACELHPRFWRASSRNVRIPNWRPAALTEARYLALASQTLLVTFAHGVEGGWRSISGEFLLAQAASLRRDGFWLCGFRECVQHLLTRRCTVITPLDQETLVGHVDASRCGVSEAPVPVCVRFTGQPLPQPPPSLLWDGETLLAANEVLGNDTACWQVPRSSAEVKVVIAQ